MSYPLIRTHTLIEQGKCVKIKSGVGDTRYVEVKWEEMDQWEIKLVQVFLASLSSKDTKSLFYEINQSDD